MKKNKRMVLQLKSISKAYDDISYKIGDIIRTIKATMPYSVDWNRVNAELAKNAEYIKLCKRRTVLDERGKSIRKKLDILIVDPCNDLVIPKKCLNCFLGLDSYNRRRACPYGRLTETNEILKELL